MIEPVQYVAAFGIPGGWEWIIILVVALLIFGRRLPEIARSLGKSLSEFKKGVNEAKQAKDEIEKDVKEVTDDIAKEAKDAAGLNDTDNQ